MEEVSVNSTTGTSKFKQDLSERLVIAGMKENVRYRIRGFKDGSKCIEPTYGKERLIVGNSIWLRFDYCDKQSSPGGGYDNLSLISFRKRGGNFIKYFESLDDAERVISNLDLELDKKYARAQIHQARVVISKFNKDYELK